MIEAWMGRPFDGSDVFVTSAMALMMGIVIGIYLRERFPVKRK
jgi:hypothetical protein